MTINSIQRVYGITERGKKIQIGAINTVISTGKYCGGKIFHIVPGDNGAEYHFYDANGYDINDVAVGDEPYAYTVDGTPAFDKYYVFHGSVLLSKTWGFNGTNLSMADGIGAGKMNTALALQAADPPASGTIWEAVTSINENEINGCDDWYVPSKAELTKYVTATDRDGNLFINALNGYLISSCEFNRFMQTVWFVSYWGASDKTDARDLLPIRSF